MKPPSLGNIYNAPLRYLSNAPVVLDNRRASLKGRLKCLPGCNLIYYEKQPILPTDEFADYNEMTYLHLNFGHYCNIHCVMCKIHIHRKNDDSILDPEILRKNIDIEPFKEIVIQGGEPLFIPECRAYLDYLGSIRKKYVLLTNGILIDNDTAIQLAKDAARVVISFNAATKETHEQVNHGSRYHQVVSNIHLLRKYRDLEQTDLVIHGRMTLTKYSLHEIPLFIENYKKIGFDRINFGYDRATVPRYLKENPNFKEKLKRSILSSLKQANLDEINFLRLKQLDLIPYSYSSDERGF